MEERVEAVFDISRDLFAVFPEHVVELFSRRLVETLFAAVTLVGYFRVVCTDDIQPASFVNTRCNDSIFVGAPQAAPLLSGEIRIDTIEELQFLVGHDRLFTLE